LTCPQQHIARKGNNADDTQQKTDEYRLWQLHDGFHAISLSVIIVVIESRAA
jgi:hypothetical protein